MGVVYRAEDTRLDRFVAIKFMRPEIIDDPGARGRFKREAQAVASLHHPNICPFFDFGEHDGHPYIVTELLEGETLSERMSGGPIPLDEVVEIATQIAEGLKTAHAKGFVHRDIKPANIFLTDEGEVKLLDFGLVKPVRWNPSMRATVPTLSSNMAIAGTIPYMSPEQLQGKPVDLRTDLFSFGVVLYEMACGKRPFGSGSAAETIAAILAEEHKPLIRRDPAVPRAFSTLLDKLLAKDSEKRHTDAKEVLSDLGKVRPEQAPSPRWRRFVPATAVAFVLIAGIVFLLSTVSVDQMSTRSVDQDGISQQALQDYAMGEEALSRRTVEGFETAMEYFKRAIEGAPEFAEAHAGLARTFAVWATAGYSVQPPAEQMNEARRAAEAALALDPDLAEAHAALGMFEMAYDREWDVARDHLIRTIELDGSNAEAHHWYALYLAAKGDLDAALEEATEAQMLEPGSTVLSALLGRIRYYREEYPQSEIQYRRALSVEEDSVPARLGLVLVYLRQRNFDAAYEQIERIPTMPEPLRQVFINAFDLSRAGGFEEAEARLAKIEGSEVMALYLAVFCAVFEEIDETLYWLDQVVENRLDYAVYIDVDPLFEFTRDDPRYELLLAEIGLN